MIIQMSLSQEFQGSLQRTPWIPPTDAYYNKYAFWEFILRQQIYLSNNLQE